ncbi:hypothetical protein GCM10027085_65100 [Spirosoma aerophilum]
MLTGQALSQPVLTITDARKPNPIAPYVYFLEDFTHKLTYEQVSGFPLDSFQAMKREKVVQLGYRQGTVWLRFTINNQTKSDLYLISSFRRYKQLNVFMQAANKQPILVQGGYDLPLFRQQIAVNPPVISLGRHPKQVDIQLLTVDSCGDFLHIGDLSQAFVYKQQTSRWQNLALGAFLIVFLFALVFFIRLRDHLLGWYTLLMGSFIVFYIDFYGFLNGYLNYSFWRQYIPVAFIYLLCWSLFHIQFLNLKHYSKVLYRAVIYVNALYWIDWPISMIVTTVTGSYFSVLYDFLYWLGIDWGGFIQIVLFLLLVSLIYVSLKSVRNLFLYTIAFIISLVSMIISMFALYSLEWLPHVPFNNLFVPGTLIEIIILGYILGERANEHRRQQAHTQQQLIDQLQENLRQKTKLLHIRDEIARDLHDEVGATLTSIAISTRLVQKKVNGQQPDVDPLLQQIQTDSQDTITAIRDTVWALNPDNDTPEKLLERLRAVAHQLLAHQAIAVLFQSNIATDTLPAFSMSQRRHIYFVFKEALHNVVKHAQATRVSIQFSRQSDWLSIQITDNGTGFESTQTGEGNGLKNFQKRASEGGFLVRVCPQPGQGTTVDIQVPLVQTTNIGDGAVVY